MKTLKEITKIFETWVTNHAQLNYYNFDNTTEIATSDITYPALWATVADTKMYNLAFDIIIFDIVEDDRTNMPDVMSDMLTIAYDFVHYLETYDDTDIEIENVGLLPFNEKYDDLTSGWIVRLNFEYINPKTCV